TAPLRFALHRIRDIAGWNSHAQNDSERGAMLAAERMDSLSAITASKLGPSAPVLSPIPAFAFAPRNSGVSRLAACHGSRCEPKRRAVCKIHSPYGAKGVTSE